MPPGCNAVKPPEDASRSLRRALTKERPKKSNDFHTRLLFNHSLAGSNVTNKSRRKKSAFISNFYQDKIEMKCSVSALFDSLQHLLVSSFSTSQVDLLSRMIIYQGAMPPRRYAAQRPEGAPRRQRGRFAAHFCSRGVYKIHISIIYLFIKSRENFYDGNSENSMDYFKYNVAKFHLIKHYKSYKFLM